MRRPVVIKESAKDFLAVIENQFLVSMLPPFLCTSSSPSPAFRHIDHLKMSSPEHFILVIILFRASIAPINISCSTTHPTFHGHGPYSNKEFRANSLHSTPASCALCLQITRGLKKQNMVRGDLLNEIDMYSDKGQEHELPKLLV